MLHYLITGASGYVGSMLAKHLSADKDVEVTALVRNRERAAAVLPANINVVQEDVTDTGSMAQLNDEYDYVFHCASVTSSSEMAIHPVEVIRSIVNGTQNLMELARRNNAKSVVYLSSMEVYGQVRDTDDIRTTEEKLGALDPFCARSCYPVAKRMAESICFSYYQEYDVPVKIARLAQTFGRGIIPWENRVFVQFARSVQRGEDIVLHTAGHSMGNYCGIDDTVAGLLTILKHGRNGEVYNVVNERNTMTILEMAKMVCSKIAADHISIRFEIPEGNPYGYASTTGLRMSGQKLMNLGWKPVQSLEQMYRDVIESLS